MPICVCEYVFVIGINDVTNLHHLPDRMLLLLHQHLPVLQSTKHLPRVRILEMSRLKANVLATLQIWYASCYGSFLDASCTEV